MASPRPALQHRPPEGGSGCSGVRGVCAPTALHGRARCALGAGGGGPCVSGGRGSPRGVEGLQRGRIQPRVPRHRDGLHLLPRVPPGAPRAGGEHPAPPVGQDAAPVLPNRLGRLVLGVARALRHRLGTPGAKGAGTPCCCGTMAQPGPPVSSPGPQQPPCTPGCLGSPVLAQELPPNVGCSAPGSPPCRWRVAAGWEWPGPVAVVTPSSQPRQPPWVLALGASSAVGHFAPVSPAGPGRTCSSSSANRTLANKGTAGAARQTLSHPAWPWRSPRHVLAWGWLVGAARAGLARVLGHMPTTTTLLCSSPRHCACAAMPWEALPDPGFLGCTIG